MGIKRRPGRFLTFFNFLLKLNPKKVTKIELAYFRKHPDEIDEFTTELTVHKMFLWAGVLLGSVVVGLSKVLSFSGLLALLSEGTREFAIDIIFEIGVALIGAAVTAYFLGILLNKQQDDAAIWRANIRRRIKETGN